MPDLQNFGHTEGPAAQVTVPDVVITATVEDGGNVVADYTGPAALHFPAVLTGLTPEQRAELYQLIAQTIVLMKAGY